MAAIDYGAVIFKNGKRFKGNELFPSIVNDGICLEFYKYGIGFHKENNLEKELCVIGLFDKYNQKVLRTEMYGYDIVLKDIGGRVFKVNLKYKDDMYVVIFGYGIDNNKEIWNKIKVKYLGKYYARKIDRLLKKYEW